MSNIDQKIEAENTTTNLIERVYQKLQNNIIKYRKVIDRPLTLSEKILIGHLDKSLFLAPVVIMIPCYNLQKIMFY